jgi:peptidase M23-like protein
VVVQVAAVAARAAAQTGGRVAAGAASGAAKGAAKGATAAGKAAGRATARTAAKAGRSAGSSAGRAAARRGVRAGGAAGRRAGVRAGGAVPRTRGLHVGQGSPRGPAGRAGHGPRGRAGQAKKSKARRAVDHARKQADGSGSDDREPAPRRGPASASAPSGAEEQAGQGQSHGQGGPGGSPAVGGALAGAGVVGGAGAGTAARSGLQSLRRARRRLRRVTRRIPGNRRVRKWGRRFALLIALILLFAFAATVSMVEVSEEDEQAQDDQMTAVAAMLAACNTGTPGAPAAGSGDAAGADAAEAAPADPSVCDGLTFPAGEGSGATGACGGMSAAEVETATKIPAAAFEAYCSGAEAYGMDWTILAGVGHIECNHGRSLLPGCPHGTANFCGARGPMQFLGNTWRAGTDTVPSGVCLTPLAYTGNPIGPPIPEGQGGGYATDGTGDGVADPWEWKDATHAAARMLVANGVKDNPERALRSYNDSASYVADVMADADDYRRQTADLIVADGEWARPLSNSVYEAHPDWFTKPHHDYPSADIPVGTGTTVYALTAGTVHHWGGDCGNGMMIDIGEGVDIIYCHGSRLLVPDGAQVEAGEAVMRSGNTGNSTGPHLHIGINVDGERHCPQDLLVAVYEGRDVPKPATLPTTGCVN